MQAKGQNDMKVIHFAARYGEDQEKVLECLNFLSKPDASYLWQQWRKSNIHEIDKFGFNVLHHAIQNGHWKHNEDDSKPQNTNVKLEQYNLDDKKYPGLFIIEQLINQERIKLGDLDKQENNALHLALLHGKPEVFMNEQETKLMKGRNGQSSLRH